MPEDKIEVIDDSAPVINDTSCEAVETDTDLELKDILLGEDDE